MSQLFDMQEIWDEELTDSPINPSALHPDMEPYGDFERKIMFVAEAPGAEEDKIGRPFQGKVSNEVLRPVANCFLDMDRDTLQTNVVTTRPPNNRFDKLTKKQIEPHAQRLKSLIQKRQPGFILSMGMPAAKHLTIPEQFDNLGLTMHRVRGRLIQHSSCKCWIGCTLHPSFVSRVNDKATEALFFNDLAAWLPEGALADRKWIPKWGFKNRVVPMLNPNDFAAYLDSQMGELGFDTESTGLSPRTSRLLCAAFVSPDNMERVHVADLTADGMIPIFKRWLLSNKPKVCQNSQYENEILMALSDGADVLGGSVWDTMTTEHILYGHPTNTSLEVISFLRFGAVYKDMVNRDNMSASDRVTIWNYCAQDAYYTLGAKLQQAVEARITGCRPAIELFNQGGILLSQYQYHGIKIDRDGMKEFKSRHIEDTDRFGREIAEYERVKEWELSRGRLFNPASADDVRDFVFEYCGLEPMKRSRKSGKASADEESLKHAMSQLPGTDPLRAFIQNVLDLRELHKLGSTYIDAMLNFSQADGLLHPNTSIHTTRTLRSSCSKPNIQQVPKRYSRGREIRRFIVPKLDKIVAADFGQLEICVLANHCRDKTLIEWINNGRDVHSFGASLPLGISESKVTKDQRQFAKSAFVFRLAYGGGKESVAKDYGISLYEAGKAVDMFFNRFPDMFTWRESTIKFYEENGYLEWEGGFRRYAPIEYTKIINTPIQGNAFHRVLYSGILIENQLRKEMATTHGIAEIHDELLYDTAKSELDMLLEFLYEYMIEAQPDTDPVKFKIEVEMGSNWLEMEEIKL